MLEEFVQIMPAPEWRAVYVIKKDVTDDVTTKEIPLIAWGLTKSSQILPISAALSGQPEDPTKKDFFVALLGPGQMLEDPAVQAHIQEAMKRLSK